jgi:Domain of unknown function (DUF4337)
MEASELLEAKPAENRRTKWIGVYVGVLAALLAVCTLGGGNASKDAMRANIDATNLWSFFQAKNIRRSVYTVASDDLELMLKAHPDWPADARATIETKIKDYRATVTRFTSDKATNEGLDELFVKGKAIEKERDVAFRKDPYFDASQAILQIAIVLASVALIAEVGVLLWFSGILAVIGTALMLNGFTLLVEIPLLG